MTKQQYLNYVEVKSILSKTSNTAKNKEENKILWK